MPSSRPLTIVIRIPDVALSRSDLNASLGLQVDRYEASLFNHISPTSGGAIGTPRLDVAMAIPHSSLSKSLTIPAQLAAAAGEAGMEVQLSVYQTE